MATDAQINANRLNSQKSTGPKTEEGKKRSCLNAFKHGLAAQDICIEGEDQDLLNVLVSELIDEWHPTTRTESMLVERLAHAYHLSKRARFLQAEYRQVACRPTQKHYLEFLLFLHRYHKDHDRAIEKCIEALHNLRKLKKEIPLTTEELPSQTAEELETELLVSQNGFVLERPLGPDSQPIPRPQKPARPYNKLPEIRPNIS